MERESGSPKSGEKVECKKIERKVIKIEIESEVSTWRGEWGSGGEVENKNSESNLKSYFKYSVYGRSHLKGSLKQEKF